ncbi:MAG: WbqC family protein [Saprospiraceae bacterium]|nr:WbqC family protein [Saprospiraceae bacterium]MBK6815922.1 WbqC family protein [Saprospiraceae bacterium]MBK8511616.1 WbqC family protein [Saprospiraceae bacterium]MBP8097017.1 WbqC family protein [Saprospiraceae bacterium]MBP9745033.1 WbqC family protein [Saprospiraceae bacterium]
MEQSTISSIHTRFTTQYFPDIPTLRHMFSSQVVLIEAAENYQKNSLRNRCYLASSTGKIMLSVPLCKGKHQQLAIREVRIAHHLPWVSNHLRTISNYYKRAPFFDHFFGDIEAILGRKQTFLLDLNWDLLHYICSCFHWNPDIAYALDFVPSREKDPLELNDHLVYPQLFQDKNGFIGGLSTLDLMFCIGPQLKYLSARN